MVYIEQLHSAMEATVASIVESASAPLRDALAASQQELVLVRAQAAQAAQQAADDLRDQAEDYEAELEALTTDYDTRISELEARIAELEAQLEPPVEPTEGLFFKLPDDIRQQSKKVWAHYFGPYPRSLNNALTELQDTYATIYNNPARTDVYNGKTWASFGGFFRNRPLFRPQDSSSNWRYNDCVFDIQTAAAAGVDGFFVDMLGLSGSNYDNYILLRNAAHDLNMGFYVIPMIDANGATGAATPQVAAQKVAEFAGKNGSYYLPDGRFVVSCFGLENKPLQWWTDMLNSLRTTYNLNPAFIGVAINWNTTPTYDAVQYGTSNWGYGADANIIRNAGDYAAQARGRGKKFMAPIVAQDCRPRDQLFDEALNTETLRASWTKAITQDADYAQIVTWSDYSENTEFAPSTARGYGPLDLSSYYLVKWKMGEFPEILRDALYLSHRSNLSTSTPTGTQTRFMAHWPRGTSRSAVRDTVEALTYLTEPATVTVKVGSQTYTYDAPAGEFAKTFPLALGEVSASVKRNGAAVASVTSPVTVKVPRVDDKQYFWFSSLRGTAGQRDPVN